MSAAIYQTRMVNFVFATLAVVCTTPAVATTPDHNDDDDDDGMVSIYLKLPSRKFLISP